MNIRFSTLAAAITTASILTACGGGGGVADSPTFADPAPFPTPTMTLATSATNGTYKAGVAFNLAWTSTDTTFCIKNGKSIDSNGSLSITEATAGQKTYTVTCVGPAEKVTKSVVVDVLPGATAEGGWQGTTNDNRNVYGVVTDKDDYWFAYTGVNSSQVVGFYQGIGTSVANIQTPNENDGAFTSPALRDVNFAARYPSGSAGDGKISSSTYVGAVSISSILLAEGGKLASATYRLPDPQPYDPWGGTLYTSNPTAWILAGTKIGELSGSISGNMIIVPPAGTPGADTKVQANDNSVNFVVDNNAGTAQLTIKLNTKAGTPAAAALITPFIAYDLTIDGAWNGASFTPTSGSVKVISCTGYCTTPALTIFPIHTLGGSLTETGGTINTITTISAVNGVDMSLTLALTPLTLNKVPSGLPLITDSHSMELPTYDITYGDTPALTNIAGTYAGDIGQGAGLVAISNFVIGINGTVTASGAGCNYSGTVAPHAGRGNLFDVTDLTATGSCAVAGSYNKAVALYNATTRTVTVMGMNTNRDKGFLFVGIKP